MQLPIASVLGLTVLLFIVLLVVGNGRPSTTFAAVIVLATITAVVAYGQGIAVLTGGLDLSIPWTITTAAVLTAAWSDGSNASAVWVVPAVLGVGATIGAVNGAGIVFLRLPPIIMTLATNVWLQGAVLIYTDGTPTGSAPPALASLMNGQWLGGWIPYCLPFLLAFAVLGTFLLRGTVFGRYVYAVGNSANASRLSGVPVRATLVGVYLTAGACSALTGVLLVGFSGQSALGIGETYLLPSLAAVVIGGASVMGGRGSYVGTLAGALLLTTIGSLLATLNVGEATREIIFGLTILVSALVVGSSSETRARLALVADRLRPLMARRASEAIETTEEAPG